ncbi:hypothetical protein L1887_43376 [Cichorium endivia]|nr:hypothetical protein L1887_43376 [Cichorium endivia]
MSYLSPEAYLPHEAPMMLLGSVEKVTDDTAVCRVAVNGQSVLAPFSQCRWRPAGLVRARADGADRRRLVRLASPAAGAGSYRAGHGARRARADLRQRAFRRGP